MINDFCIPALNLMAQDSGYTVDASKFRIISPRYSWLSVDVCSYGGRRHIDPK